MISVANGSWGQLKLWIRVAIPVPVLIVMTSLFAASASGQHEGHMMGETEGGNVVFRMPPMNMPMLPGLETSIPPLEPFLAGLGMDPMVFPEARPREIVDLLDGDEIHLHAGIVRRTIAGVSFLGYGYNGQFPGPLLRAAQGSTITVHFTNDAEMPATIRWHGIRGNNESDGTPSVTQDPVPVGGVYSYEVSFTDAGIFWYHAQIRSDIQVDLGLYGNALVTPLDDDYYSPVNREEVLVLDDIMIDERGPFPWGSEAPNHALMGRYGNILLLNGTTDYSSELDRGDIVRYYLTNAANTRTFNVTFGGVPIKVVASDLSRYENEQMTGSVVIAPGERYIVEVKYEDSGTFLIENTIQAIDHFRGIFYPEITRLGSVLVGSTKARPDFTPEFNLLRANRSISSEMDDFRQYFDKKPDHEVELTLRVRGLPLPIMMMMSIDTLYVPPIEFNDAMPMMNWLSTGNQVFWVMRDKETGKENMEIYWDFDQGDVVKIRIHNNPRSFHPMNHPIHMHGQRFLVLDIDGVRNTNLVWKDTVIIPVASTVDLLVDMSNPGEWVMHCHIAEHLHSGMMLSFGVWPDE